MTTQPTQPTSPADVLPPTPTDIDTAIERYESAVFMAKQADEKVASEKARVMFLVEHFGVVPAHAAQSKRLAGQHNEATITWNTSHSVNEERVGDFLIYLAKEGYTDLAGRFFAEIVKHKMVEGADDVLKTLSLPNRIREKIASLFGLAIVVKTSAPSLKVKTIQPEKPVRAKRAAKVAA